ncbi:MAG TPA: tRNA epoxyqueuosine(34) reductase QueG [Acidobacteriaceae bacterium]|nr:tRNA epoxyqueuosine(34) reductase QueG [Acidobacteriaceae bacterium]
MWTAELRVWVEAEARAAGFDAAGVAEVRGVEDAAVLRTAERFAAWVDAGHAGEMEWLKRRDEAGRLVRSALQVAMPWARSVVVCAMNYNADATRSVDQADVGSGWIARYAWSGREGADGECVPTDYHDELLGRLRRIETGLVERVGGTTRCYVDTGPMVERSLAVEAGLGWIGKNTCVIRQGVGSWLLLGVIITSLPVEVAGAAILSADRCGSCTRCIDACPTDALVGGREVGAAREMDASRCIAYLTIEKKGAIADELREGMGRQVFGCDICQDVCPWNRKAPVGGGEGMRARTELVNPALEWLAGMDAKEFKRRFKGSPLERTGRKRLLRNVAIAMGNSGEEKFLARLDEWRAGEDGVLAEAAEWARGRIMAGALNPHGVDEIKDVDRER